MCIKRINGCYFPAICRYVLNWSIAVIFSCLFVDDMLFVMFTSSNMGAALHHFQLEPFLKARFHKAAKCYWMPKYFRVFMFCVLGLKKSAARLQRQKRLAKRKNFMRQPELNRWMLLWTGATARKNSQAHEKGGISSGSSAGTGYNTTRVRSVIWEFGKGIESSSLGTFHLILRNLLYK